MKVLIILILADLVVGTVCGFVHKNVSSKVGLIGLMKHSLVVLIVYTFSYLADDFNLSEYALLLISFYYIQYSISIIENMYCLGIPVPEILLVRLKDYEQEKGLKQWKK